ncbi:damage-inducible protein [Pasteurellaceae bacterium Pebbles2]|nr:damage-inducible protein [Pasteurellaceae bacterium Pebbles2]
MATESYVRARIDNQVKQEAILALQAMGLNMSDFIRIAITKLAKEKAIPFELKVPNAETAQAIQDARAMVRNEIHAPTFQNAEALFNALDNDEKIN